MFEQRLHAWLSIALGALLMIALEGCILGGGGRGVALTREESHSANAKLTVDAYLFDVKFRDNGKRRSVRLDVYFTDTLALFTARGYLGKGVAKGVWRPDSSLFYFPTVNEFYSGPLDEMTRAGCASGGELQRLLPTFLSGRLLHSLPIDGSLSIDKKTEKTIDATAILGACETPVKLIFDKQAESPFFGELFYLKEFSYVPADGQGRVVGKRRILKRNKGLEARKFIINIPTDAKAVQW